MITAEARGAWKELESRLRPYLARRVASRADIDDLLQEVFVRMHQGLGQLRDEQRFGGWAYKIAHSVLVDRSRALARRPQVSLDDGPETASDDVGGEAAEAELRAALSDCVAAFVTQLPSPYREAITLTELQGLTQKEAAELLGVSISGVKSRVQRGREKLRNLFEACCELSVDVRGKVRECEPRGPLSPSACCSGADVPRSRREPLS